MSSALLLASLLLVPGTGADTREEQAATGLQPVMATVVPPPPPPRALRIVSYNVRTAPQPLALADSLRRNRELAHADVILIQDIEEYPQEGTSRAAQLATALGLNYVYAPARLSANGEGTHGLAILSRFPLRDIEVIPLPEYNLRFNTRRRIALAAGIEVGASVLRVYNVHLDTRLNPAERREQLRPLLARVNQEEEPRVVVGGDFNTAPFRWLGRVFPIFRADQAALVDQVMRNYGFQTQLARAGPTSRRGLLRFRLDSIYTRGLRVNTAGVEHTVSGSDHVPLWVEVAWP